MMISPTEDTPPVCLECKKRRVSFTEYTPFMGIGEKRRKFHRYCEVCAELKREEKKQVNNGLVVAQRISKAKADGHIPWFMQHDMKKMNQPALQSIGSAAFHGSRKVPGGMKLRDSGVWAWGRTGTCKSRSFSRLSEYVYALGHTIRWVRFSDALRGHVAALVDDDGGAARRYFEGFKAPNVLVIDDFGCGKAKLSPTGLEFLFDIIDDRYMRFGTDMCPLWVTSQAPPAEAIKQSLAPECRGYDATPMIRRIEEITTEVEV